MHRKADPWSLAGVVVGLLAAAAAGGLVLLMAAVGQALGGMLAGCSWIGVSTPPYRQVWALVNEPVLDFAALPRAFGYWWGSLLLPLAAAGLTVPLLPRPRTVAAELGAVQVAWMATVVGVGWLPLLDPVNGHLVRWLGLAKLPPWLVWLAPAAAGLLAIPLTLRLLALSRAARRDLPRLQRVALVTVQLALPAAAWVVMVVPLRGGVPAAATLGLAVPVVVALAVGWSGYPSAHAFRLEELGGGALVRMLLSALVVWALVLACGRPLPDGNTAGVLWAAPGARNNVRLWIQPTTLFSAPGTSPQAGQQSD